MLFCTAIKYVNCIIIIIMHIASQAGLIDSLFCLQKANVSMVDHHTATEGFITFFKNEVQNCSLIRIINYMFALVHSI